VIRRRYADVDAAREPMTFSGGRRSVTSGLLEPV
jgi:hypothetical protein